MRTAKKNITNHEDGEIEIVIEARIKDLGEFVVRRTLPRRARQRVGPFIFFDHMGPVDFPPGSGIAVRPHPHIGLATVTYLFDGEIVHRDSLGHVQPIQPGAVNLMTAGRGIVHSERSSEELTVSGSSMHGLQTWLALPTELEEIEPSFDHYPAKDIPVVDLEGVWINVIAGSAYGATSPVVTSSETLILAVKLASDASLEIPALAEERAIYLATGAVSVGERQLNVGDMAVLNPEVTVSVHAASAAKLVIIGGAALEGERHLYWNLVSSHKERIEQAKDDWRNNRFEKVPGETEFIPLPN